MKKLIAIALMLISISLAIFADPLIEVVDGNIDEFDIINSAGIKIADGFSANSDGYLIRVKNEPVEATSPLGELKLKENTLLAIIDTKYSAPVLYLVYGEMSLLPAFELDEMMSIYTPTSRIRINGEGEFVFISTDEREEFYNYGILNAEAFNSITGQEFKVPALHAVNFLNKEGNPFLVSEDAYYSTTSDIVKTYTIPAPRVPLAPTFSEPTRKLDRPGAPLIEIINQTLRENAPEKPVVKISLQELLEGKKTPTIDTEYITIQQILVDVPSAPEVKVFTTIEDDAATPVAANAIAEEIEDSSIVEPSVDDTLVETIEEVEDVIVEEKALAEESSSSSLIKASANPNKGSSFNVDFASRTFFNSAGEKSVNVSIIPRIKINSFYMDLNIDPLAILEYKKNTSFVDWVGYGFNFINYVRYRTLNEVFDATVSRTMDIPSSDSGIYDGYKHSSDRYAEKLSAIFHLNTRPVDVTVGIEDLTFGRFSPLYGINRAFGKIDVTFSQRYKLRMYAGAVANFNNAEPINSMDFYPEAGIYIPFVDRSATQLGMNVALTTAIPANNRILNPEKMGFMLSGSIPMKFGIVTIEPGIYYSYTGSDAASNRILHFNATNSIGYNPVETNETLLTLATNFEVKNNIFGFNALISGDIKLKSMKFFNENSLLNVSGFVDLSVVKLAAGIKIQDFISVDKYSKNLGAYGSLQTNIAGISTTISGGVNSIEDKDFYFSFAAKTTFSEDKEALKGRGSNLVSFDIEHGIKYSLENGISFIANPMFTFGSSRYALSLRAPFEFKFENDKAFIIEGNEGNNWWEFGIGANTIGENAYKTLTNAFALINYLKLGGRDTSRAYFVAERENSFSDTLFAEYGGDGSLNLNLGFNSPNMRFNAFAGDIEQPHLAEISLATHPINLASFSINFDIPAEIYFKDFNNFTMFFYPEFILKLPIVKNYFTLSAYAAGTVSGVINDGRFDFNSIKLIYDLNTKTFHSSIAGAKVDLKFSRFSIVAEGGIRTGILRPDMYNAFTTLYNKMPSIEAVSSPSSYFGKVQVNLDFDVLDFSLTYTSNDVMKAVENFVESDDIFSLKTRVRFNEISSIYANIHRKGFASLFDGSKTFDSIYKSADTIYAVGMDFDFGKASLNAELSSTPLKDAFTIDSGYMNVQNGYDTTKGVVPTFSISTRISF